ncbi:response regulator [Phytomonospora endophytica]|uniref:DNA-binding NarL/FixJ family response regulator n=1 Tax=Phytomonospora endophytica TaxID=714109 RepID=A0A841FRG7_9ACTN|nr:response regulator transcription factor [Phytomonospora endophytica]MBB6038815.1 DNA-binding NarL/FixJ family response regulator [Phytomonospora endophytica]GIG68389.1 DNA-binding response regulator [Phytomonospora endophytica]
MTIRVVIADDQELVRVGFGMILGAQPDMEVVAEVDDGAAAIEAVRALEPDVVLLDIQMPGVDGIEAARSICAGSTAKVIMLTTFARDEYLYASLRAGASGFLLKDVRGEDLVHAVRVARSGEALLAPAVTRRLIDDVARQTVRPRLDDSVLDRLTERERQTLLLLGRAMSNAEIAREMVVSDHTVKTHVSNVLTKLGLRDRAQAVISAYETGLIVPGGEPPGAGGGPLRT